MEGGVGSGHRGDIAVDDVQVIRGPCLEKYQDGKFMFFIDTLVELFRARCWNCCFAAHRLFVKQTTKRKSLLFR